MRLVTRASTIVFVAAAAALGAWWFRSSAEAWRPVPRANLLVVTVDTLRADRLTDGMMPQLAPFARRSHVFKTAYAHAPLTLPSHASLFTGLLPPAHGVRGNGGFRLADAQVTLAERLKLAGYQTGAFVGAFVLDPRFGLAQGFDTYRAVDDGRAFAADFAFSERRADAVLRDADGWLQTAMAAGQPWHAWIHLFDPHAPYAAPGRPAGSYDEEVRYVDAQLGAFLARLQARGALERTVVVVTADHGESLGAHGESTHGLFVYDATVRVPLVIAGPGIGAATTTGPVGHIDLVPTVLDTLGLPPDPVLPGRSLRAGDHGGRPVYVEAMEGWLSAGAAPARGIIDGGLKLISVPETELYDLAADPDEVRNLHPTGDPRARPLAEALARLGESGDFSKAPARDPAADARLRSLGYAAGAARPPNRAFGVADDPKRVRALHERFLAILGRGIPDPDGALAILRERPAFEAARLAAASWFMEAGRGPDAVRVLEEAASAPGASAPLVERLGAAWLASGDPRRAVEVLLPVTGVGASADAWNTLGIAHAQMGDRAAARRALDTAIELAPAAARFRLNRVIVHLEDGDRTAALADAAEVVARAPDLADGWRLRATLHYESGQRDAAIADWQQAVRLAPGDADSLFNLAVALAAAGRPADAAAAAERYLALPARPGGAADAARMRALRAAR